MKRSTVLILATLSAVGLAVVPSLLPTGPAADLGAASLLGSGQMWFAALVIFGGGLLTSLTPCVYPLIPITVGVFGARQADSRGRALVLTTAYVVGMGLVFSALGVFAALSGRAFGSVLGNQWVVVALAIFMVVLAASMFGAFELALPTSLATKLNGVGGGGLIGALLMGSVAGFLAAPCTGPVLTGVLAWVSQTRDPVLGGALLFIYALGIGVPFFLIGVFTVRLPKSGVWMEHVKSVFGIALLALAVSYLRDGFPTLGDAIATGVAALGKTPAIVGASVLAFAGVVAGAIHLSFKEGRQWIPKGAGVAVLLVAFVVRMAAQHGVVEFWHAQFHAPELATTTPFEETLAKAKADCRPVMIDFFADWCTACKELDQRTYVADGVKAEAKRFVTVKVDGTEELDSLEKLYAQFDVKGLPTVAFVDAYGKVLTTPRVVGFLPPDEFLAEMQKVQPGTCTP